MRPDKHTEYFPADFRTQRHLRSTKRASHTNILEQFERKPPVVAVLPNPTRQKSPLRGMGGRMQSPPHSTNTHSHQRLPANRKTRPLRGNESHSREYNAEYTGIIRMSESLQRNRVEMTLQRTSRKNLRMDITHSEHPNYKSQVHSQNISITKKMQIGRNSSDRSMRDLKPSRYYSSAVGKAPLNTPISNPNVATTFATEQQQDSTFRKVLLWYSQQIDSFVRLAQHTTPTKDTKVDASWAYYFYCTLRNKFERLLHRLWELNRKPNVSKPQNLTVLESFHARVQQDNAKIAENYGKLAVNQIKRSALRQNQHSRRQLNNQLSDEIASINSQQALSPEQKHRLDVLQQCLRVVELLRTGHFLQYFEREYFS